MPETRTRKRQEIALKRFQLNCPEALETMCLLATILVTPAARCTMSNTAVSFVVVMIIYC
jgi:hypothetical protein